MEREREREREGEREVGKKARSRPEDRNSHKHTHAHTHRQSTSCMHARTHTHTHTHSSQHANTFAGVQAHMNRSVCKKVAWQLALPSIPQMQLLRMCKGCIPEDLYNYRCYIRVHLDRKSLILFKPVQHLLWLWLLRHETRPKNDTVLHGICIVMDKHICHPLIFSIRLSLFISHSHPPFLFTYDAHTASQQTVPGARGWPSVTGPLPPPSDCPST